MEQGKLKLINIAALFVLLLLIGAAFFTGFERMNSKSEDATTHFSSLWDQSLRLVGEKGKEHNTLFEGLRQMVRDDGELRSFILYDENDRVYYVFGRRASYVHFATSTDEKYRSTVTLIRDSPFDRQLRRSSEAGIRAEAVYSLEAGIRAEAVYSTLSRPELFRISQALLLGLTLLTIILVVCISLSARSSGSKNTVIYGAAPPQTKRQEDEKPAQAEQSDIDDQFHPDTEEGLYSERSGFCREMFLRPRLESELKRAAAFDQDLVLAFVRCVAKDDAAEKMDLAGSSELHDNAISFFPFQDLLFEFDETTFAVILPNTDLDQGIELLTNFQHHLFEIESCTHFDTAVGLSSRNGRLIDHDRIITETNTALKKAVLDPETKLIGFRPDPGKYRSYVAQKKP